MINRLLAAIPVITCLFSMPVFATEDPGPLVSASWVHDHHRDQDLTVIDIQPASEFILGHVDGAVNMPFDRTPWTIGTGGITGMLPKPQELANLLKNHGVAANDRIIITAGGFDASSMMEAARVYWSLKTIGVRQLHLLDGGIQSFQLAGLPLKQGPQYVRPRRPYYAGRGPVITVDRDQVAAFQSDGGFLIDTREPEFYTGERKRPFILKAGPIKDAINIPAASVLEPMSNTIKSKEALAALIAEAQTTGPQIVYSDRGISAALVWFVLYEVLGNRETRLYDGSMMDWASRR